MTNLTMQYGLKISLQDMKDILTGLVNSSLRVNVLLYDNMCLPSCEVTGYNIRSSTISLKSYNTDHTVSLGKIKHIEFREQYIYKGIASKLFSTV